MRKRIALGLRRASLAGVLVACTSTDGSAALTGAFDSVSSESTNLRLARAGDGYGNRYGRMRELVHQVNDLIGGGSDAKGRLIAAFLTTPGDFSEDAALVVYAYALGEMRDQRAIAALTSFLLRTRAGDLLLAPQAATHTLLTLLNDPQINNATYFYTLADISRAAEASSESFLTASSAARTVAAAASSRKSCTRRYLLLDAAGKPLSGMDAQGNVVPLAIEGTEFFDVTRVSAKSEWERDVKNGNGIYLSDFDSGAPSRRFNCAGYAFRELNGGAGWNVDAQTLFRNLSAAGLLRQKGRRPSRGDKVLYLHEGSPAHVAEVERVEVEAIIVRNADNQSGVFEAAIDAPYYKARQYDAKIYEWSARPRYMEDPAVLGDPAYCTGHAPMGLSAGDGGANAAPPDNTDPPPCTTCPPALSTRP